MPPTTAANTTTTSASYGTLVIRNGTGNAGRPEQRDQIVVTFASPPHPSAFCSGWNTSSAHSLTNPNVVVTGTHSGGGDNTLTVSDTSDCAGGLHFGSIELGQAGYFNGSSTTFGGSSLVCNGLLNLTGCGTIAWDGHNTLTVTLGRTGSGQPTKKTPDVAVYTPDAALGVAGTIKSPSEVQF